MLHGSVPSGVDRGLHTWTKVVNKSGLNRVQKECNETMKARVDSAVGLPKGQSGSDISTIENHTGFRF